jgi:hypothetical protein
LACCIIPFRGKRYTYATRRDFGELTNEPSRGFKLQDCITLIRSLIVITLCDQLECCGVDNPHYWKGSLPDGCCVNPSGGCTNPNDPKQVFQEGCVQRLEELLHGIGLLLGVLAIVIGIVEVREFPVSALVGVFFTEYFSQTSS